MRADNAALSGIRILKCRSCSRSSLKYISSLGNQYFTGIFPNTKKQIDYVDWIELIKFKETRNYVQRVLENYNVYNYIVQKKPVEIIDFFKNKPLY